MSELSRLVRKLEHVEAFPLISLQASRELRHELDEVEGQAIRRARELGASLEEIADAMQITRQGVSYKLKTLGGDGGDVVVEVREPAEASERSGDSG